LDSRNFNGEITSLYGALIEKTNHFMDFIDLPYKYVRFQLIKASQSIFDDFGVNFVATKFNLTRWPPVGKHGKSSDFIRRILLLIHVQLRAEPLPTPSFGHKLLTSAHCQELMKRDNNFSYTSTGEIVYQLYTLTQQYITFIDSDVIAVIWFVTFFEVR
jgi:hypothetical protein